MEINLFLWPMLVPMLLPLLYSMKYKKEALREIATILLVMILIIVLYWPLLTSGFFSTYTYIVVKTLLFVLLPIIAFTVVKRDTPLVRLTDYGIKKEGTKKSLIWFIVFLPLMLATTFLLQYFNGQYFPGIEWNADVIAGSISFFEAFTEEFFFRGVLFILLSQKIPIKIAYVTSLTSFILMHPQNFDTLFILGTILQGVLTLEIARKSQNILGAWFLHGSNRFFQLAILPFIM